MRITASQAVIVFRLSAAPSNPEALFMTDLGSLDFLGDLSGREISSLRSRTDEFQLQTGSTLKMLDLETLIEVKAAAGRPKDQMVLPILRETLRERERLDE